MESLEVRQLFSALTWNPLTTDRTWDHSTTNWLDTATNTQVAFADGDSVTFGNRGGSDTVVVAAGGVSPSQTTFDSPFEYTIQQANPSINGPINGNGSLIKNNTGKLGFAIKGSAYTGDTIINGGLFEVLNTGIPDNSAVTVAAGATFRIDNAETVGSLAGAGTTFFGNSLFVGGNDSSTNYSGILDGPGALTKTGAGTMTLSGSQPNTRTGATTIEGGIIELNKTTGVDALSGTLVTLNGGTLRALASDQINGATAVRVGSGLYDLNGFNETMGATFVDGPAATLNIGTGTLHDTGQISIKGSVTVPAGGTISTADFTLGDGFVTTSLNIGGTVTVSGNGTVLGNVTTLTVQGGGVMNTGAGLLRISSNGTVVQAGGVMNIGTGGLQFFNASNLLTVNSDDAVPGQFNLAGNLSDTAAFGSRIANGGAGAFAGVVNLIGDLIFSTQSDTLAIGTVLNLPAANTLTLSTTTASSAKIEFDRAMNLAGSVAVLGTVDHVGNNLTVGTTLSGTGTILGAATTFVVGNVSPGAHLGNDVGTLSTTNLNLNSGAVYNAQLESSSDLLNVTGSVNIAGAILNVSGSAPSATYTLISNDGTDPVNGVFNGYPEGAPVSIGSQSYVISYVGGDGNDVTLIHTDSTSVSVAPVTTTYGTSVTLTATVTDSSNSSATVNGGNVSFTILNSSNAIVYSGTAPVSEGTASSTPVTGLGAGSYTIQAIYQGSGNFQASSPATAPLTIQKATLTVTADDQSKTYGGADPTLTYTPSGTLYYGDSYGVITGVSLSTTTNASVGTYAIVATGGSAANYNITDVNGTLTVTPDQTTANVVASGTGPVTFTVTISPVAPGTATPVGQVQFYDNTVAIGGPISLDANGQASVTSASLTAGTHTITVNYLGTPNFLASSASTSYNVPAPQVSTGIILLDRTASGALSVTGNGFVEVQDGSIIVDSTSSTAVQVNGNGEIVASNVNIDGGDSTSGQGAIDAVVLTGQAYVADPLASLPDPALNTLTLQSNTTLILSDNVNATLNPGVYQGGNPDQRQRERHPEPRNLLHAGRRIQRVGQRHCQRSGPGRSSL